MAKIFISYRRDDSQYQADRLYHAAQKWVEDPKQDIFIDVDKIPFGVDFEEHLDERVSQCSVLLALIGKDWLDIKDNKGQRRLDDPNDFVRIEIVSALNRKIRVVPILFDGASMPRAETLPDDLKRLTKRHGIHIQRQSFEHDVDRLMQGLGFGANKESETRPETTPLESARQSAVKYAPVSNRVFQLDLPGVRNWPKPEMVAIPPGTFLMGSPIDEEKRVDDEGPQHEVRIDYPFALGKHTVTFAEWDAAVAAGAKLEKPGDQGWGRGDRPVINVSWEDVQAHLDWLNEKAGLAGKSGAWRLPSEAEWEYACRAGTTTPFSFGETISTEQANYNGNYIYGASEEGQYLKETMPVGDYPPNAFGLHQMHGNVWEWCADIWHENYDGAPGDGSVWKQGGDISRRVLRGGSWVNGPRILRSANRNRNDSVSRFNSFGFRLARTL